MSDNNTGANLGFEDKLWMAVDKLYGKLYLRPTVNIKKIQELIATREAISRKLLLGERQIPSAEKLEKGLE